MEIDYGRFVRVITRCGEVAEAEGPTSIVGLVYKERAEAPIKAFLDADKAASDALGAHAKENSEADKALAPLDGAYRVARSAVSAVLPNTVLPDTLKSQPTDTDKLNAIERLVDIIDDHAGTPWADALLAGEFGQLAPKTVKEVNESIASNKALAKALTARAAAYGPAYEAYLAFKRVVRDARGPGSKEYRRIHLRASPGSSAEQAEAPKPNTDVSGAPATPAPANPDGGAPKDSAQPPA